MKLLVKTSLYYIVLSIPTLIAAGFICYFLITSEVKDSNNELLLKRKVEIEKYLQENDTIPLNMLIRSGEASISVMNAYAPAKNVFKDTLFFDVREKEWAPHRMLSTVINTNHGTYLVHVWRSTLEFEELFEGIFIALLFVLLLFLIIFFLINWWVSKTLWKPFYKSIEVLQSFRASDKDKPELPTSTVNEFNVLIKSLSGMMDKLKADFKSQKEFTENASHEIQTPLAVIKSKIDLLIQSDKLGKNESDLILAIDDASSKIIRLTKSLLLLTKIENRQFQVYDNVSLNKIISESLNLFDDQIKRNDLNVITNAIDDVNLRINPDLCSVLLNNIIQNAIRHNIIGGTIEIRLDKMQLTISNSGNPIDASKLFDRFQKNSSSPESLGLGLAISKEIADASEIKLLYKHDATMHHFILVFDQNI